MTRSKFSRRMARPFGDFLVGLCLFGALALPVGLEASQPGGGWLATSAHARHLELELMDRMIEMVTVAPVPAAGPSLLAVVCMGVAFASLFSMNLWFARHVRAAHASYQRGKI
jgi:hypothetical protein